MPGHLTDPSALTPLEKEIRREYLSPVWSRKLGPCARYLYLPKPTGHTLLRPPFKQNGIRTCRQAVKLSFNSTAIQRNCASQSFSL